MVRSSRPPITCIEVPDRPEVAGHISFVLFPSLDVGSRAKRASQAADQLRSSAEAVREFVEENKVATESV